MSLWHRVILDLNPVPVDGAGIEPGRRPRLQSTQAKSETAQAYRETAGCSLADSPTLNLGIAAVHDSGQECTRGQDHSIGAYLSPVCQLHTHNTLAIDHEVHRLSADDLQSRCCVDHPTHLSWVEIDVNLSPTRLNSETLSCV